MDRLILDLRYAFRSLAKAPGVIVAAVLSLGLGIGAATVVFTWMRAVLLEPLPGVADSSRLLAIETTDPDEVVVASSYTEYRDLVERTTTFSGVIAFDDQVMALSGVGEAERLWGLIVSANYFDVLGVRPILGRGFRAEEDKTPGGAPVLVLSHAFWQRKFGGDPGIVGRAVTLNDHPFTVVGVAPPGFWGTRPGLAFDAYVPLMMQQQVVPGGDRLTARSDRWLGRLGRLKPGVTAGEAQAELTTLATQLEREYPESNRRRGFGLFPLGQAPRGAGRVLGSVLAVLAVVVALVLLIACANTANLLLARAAARQGEMAVRLSLGATRGRLARQLLTESALLGLLGGVAGVLFAWWGSGSLMWFVPSTDFPLALDLSLDPRAFGFAALVSLLAALAFGLVPALQASRGDTAQTLRAEAVAVASGRRARLRHGLVVAQVALSFLLLVTAGLFLRSLGKTNAHDTGFEARGVLLVSFDLFPSGYSPERGARFYEDLLARARTLPGVTAASYSRRVPLGFGGSSSTNGFKVEGYTPPPGKETFAFHNHVGPDYFKAMRIPLLRGRDFADSDAGIASKAIVISEEAARRYWQGRDPIGGRVSILGDSWTVVGVAGDVNYRKVGEAPRPLVYFPVLQSYRPNMTLHLRTSGDPLALAEPARKLVASLDPNLPVFGIRSLEALTAAASFESRIGATLLGFFGAAALALASIGLYGVLAYAVSQRRRELGVRVALGASPRDIVGLVVRQGAVLAGTGSALGLLVALAAGRLLASQLFGVSPGDPATFAGVALILFGVALFASYLPARRATRVDPVTALRHE